MNKPPIFFLLIFLLFSCAHDKKLSAENRDFYQIAGRAKSEMAPKDYKRWLLGQLQNKKAMLAGLTGSEEREGRLLGNHETMTESASTVGGPQDVHGFQADRSRQRLKELDDERKMIERHIFYINSQLSELDSKVKI